MAFLMLRSDSAGERLLTPSVVALGVPLLKGLLDGLLRLLPLGWLLERVRGDGSLQRLELEHVSGGEEVGVVDDFDERLDLGSLGDLLLAHRLGHFQGVSSTRNQLNLSDEKES